MRGWVAILAIGTGCTPPAAAPAPASSPAAVADGCGERLAAIPYLLQRVGGVRGAAPVLTNAKLVLDEQGQAALAAFVARMAAEPGLDVAIEMHMDPETRGSAAPGVARDRLTRLGAEVASQVRSQVRPDRAALVVYGAPGAPLDGAQHGSWIALTRRCGPVDGDRDHDGIADAHDACLDAAEDHDGYADGDGCPDHDNDGDGVLDAHTWDGTRWSNCDGKIQGERVVDCRDVPEDLDRVEDDDGCPDVMAFDCALVRGRVEYDPKTLRIVSSTVDAALAELQHWAARWAVELVGVHFTIDGHTGKMRDKASARELSMRAATVVRDELVRRGITADRLEIRAMGDQVPIASERTPEGRRANFRVDVVWEYCGTGARPLCR
jgi:hypothetical protein